MTFSPESTRPLTRRARRERLGAPSERADEALPSYGDDPRMEGREGPEGDTFPSVPREDPPAPARAADTVAVDVVPAPKSPGTDPVSPDTDPMALFLPSDNDAQDDLDDDLDGEYLDDEYLDDATNEVTLPAYQTVPAAEPYDHEEPAHEEPARESRWADAKQPPTALTWLDDTAVAAVAPLQKEAAPDLFAGAKLTPGWRRPRVLIPIGIVAALGGAYAATTLLWPLHAVAPQITASEVAIDPAPAATATWPANGSAAVAVQGITPLASTTEADGIASITKVASTLMVLDELPLAEGEQGPSFDFTYSDARDYWSYRRSNQSSLDVPVGSSLTEYQMLQGILLGSANNYIDRLSDEIWGSDRKFAQASEKWLSDRGITGVTLVTPSGFDRDNVATPAGLIQLGELAMRNPVFSEIVGTRSAEIPGVGTVTNSNRMLEDEGVVGVKTGTLEHWNLLTAKDVTVGDTTVRLFAAVLGQENSNDRLTATRQLFAEVEKSLAEQPVSVPKGTVVGQVTTEWGDTIDVVTDADAKVVLWNGATATTATEFDLGEKTASGDTVGTLSASGPIDDAQSTVSLAEDIPAPSIWWRLTHPMELFGLDKD